MLRAPLTFEFPAPWNLKLLGIFKERVRLVALLPFLAGRKDGERSQPPPSARARAADPVEGPVQLREQQPSEQPVQEFCSGEASHHR